MNKRVMIGIIVFFVASVGVFAFATTSGDPKDDESEGLGGDLIEDEDEESEKILTIGDIIKIESGIKVYTSVFKDNYGMIDDNEVNCLVSGFVALGGNGKYLGLLFGEEAAGTTTKDFRRSMVDKHGISDGSKIVIRTHYNRPGSNPWARSEQRGWGNAEDKIKIIESYE